MEENKNFEIVVDDGAVDVPISNTLGERIGMFRFRPTDFNIVKRYQEISDKFGDVVAPLINADISATGEGEDEPSMKILQESQDKLFELVDYLFDGNASEAFFGKMNPFSPVKGKFYCEYALDAVGQFIGKQFDEEIKAINTRVEKYTHGYRTGKHKDGRKK